MSQDMLQQLDVQQQQLSEQLPHAKNQDEALDIAIRAADLGFKALSLATAADEKARYTTLVKTLVADAERIKKSSDWRAAVVGRTQHQRSSPDTFVANQGSVRHLNEPQNSRELSTREKIILERAGFLNDAKFPRWQDSPAAGEFELKPGGSLFLDDASELPLSDFQNDVLDAWKRPADAIPPPSYFPGSRANLGPLMSSSRDVDLVQDAATDCSVVASLCASEARSKRGYPSLSQLFFHPFDAEKKQPRTSPNGKYIMRLNFNGCYRKVVIDDCIPTSATERVIHVMDRNNPCLLWPALVEKAYLKVRGGYDFPGSNSGTDLWILTGWIPEQVFLQADELEPNRFWQQMYESFSWGDVLITMGTGKMSRKTEREMGLAGEHDYAVLDLCEVDGQRLLLVKNPWVEGTSWRGGLKPKNLIEHEHDGEHVSSPRDLLNADEQLRPGTFWMDLDNVLQYFESIYLNWNTGLFSFRQDIHFSWDFSGLGEINQARGSYASLQHNPQFAVTAQKADEVWILLWRHFQNSQSIAPGRSTRREQQEVDFNGHIALSAFDSGGRRLVLSEKHLQKSWFVDSPQTLLKLENCEAGKAYTIVPLEEELSSIKQTFTISAFSNSRLSLAEAAPRFSHSRRLSASWTKETAGGNAQNATYTTNPQFVLAVPRKTSIRFLVEACDSKLNVHVKLLHSNGKRKHRVQKRDIVVDSKDYRRGCCLAELEDLDPGQYTIICSTFEPQQFGDFSLLVESSQPIDVLLLPREDAGRVRLELAAAAFRRGENRIAAPLAPQRLVKLYATARCLDRPGKNSNRSHVRISIEVGTGAHRIILIASNGGEFVDSGGFVRTEDIDLAPDYARKFGYADCWLVVDRMYVSEDAQEEKFAVELLVDQVDAMGYGVWRAME